MSRVVQDLRHALRACVRTPLVGTLAVIAFALGIGVTTAVFSIFYNVLLKPLPYPDPEQLVMVYDTQPACATCPGFVAEVSRLENAQSGVFRDCRIDAGRVRSVRPGGSRSASRRCRRRQSLVDVFKVQPAVGRWFTEAEDQPSARKVVVLSHGLLDAAIRARPVRSSASRLRSTVSRTKSSASCRPTSPIAVRTSLCR